MQELVLRTKNSQTKKLCYGFTTQNPRSQDLSSISVIDHS